MLLLTDRGQIYWDPPARPALVIFVSALQCSHSGQIILCFVFPLSLADCVHHLLEASMVLSLANFVQHRLEVPDEVCERVLADALGDVRGVESVVDQVEHTGTNHGGGGGLDRVLIQTEGLDSTRGYELLE